MLAGLACLCALMTAGHALVPNRVGNAGSLFETFLPWTGLAVPALMTAALMRRSATAAIAVVLPAVVWAALFGGAVTDKQRPAAGDLTVLTHNVDEDNRDPQGTGAVLAASGADIVALEELDSRTAPVYTRALAVTYRYHSVQGTVGLWSRYPVTGVRTLDILPWPRALHATVTTPHGAVSVFVAHLASVRVGAGHGFGADARDASARILARAVRDDHAAKTLLLGDFNGSAGDRAFSRITSRMRSAQAVAGDGFGFSWPAAFPVVRIDQIFVRGAEPTAAWVLPATGSDHRPVAARIRL